MTDPKVKYVYICYHGIDYEGETIDKVFENERSAELWSENNPNGDYRGVWKEKVN